MLACDALLDQDIFAGVGNIIKNEVLFRIRLHPLSTVGAMPAPKLRALVEQARTYSFDFLEWKKQYVLKKHWLAHAKPTCPRCDIQFTQGQPRAHPTAAASTANVAKNDIREYSTRINIHRICLIPQKAQLLPVVNGVRSYYNR